MKQKQRKSKQLVQQWMTEDREQQTDALLKIRDMEGSTAPWISVEDEIPKRHKVVSLKGGEGVWNGKQWRVISFDLIVDKPLQWPVTHWQTLTDPPQ